MFCATPSMYCFDVLDVTSISNGCSSVTGFPSKLDIAADEKTSSLPRYTRIVFIVSPLSIN